MRIMVDILGRNVFSNGEDVLATANAWVAQAGKLYSPGDHEVFYMSSVSALVRPGMVLACAWGRFAVLGNHDGAITAAFEGEGDFV